MPIESKDSPNFQYEVKEIQAKADSLHDMLGYVEQHVRDLEEIERFVFRVELKDVT